MKQFSLAEYLKNPERKIVTRDGRPVKRILCIDAKGDYPIVALIKSKSEKEEYPFRYTVNGQFFPGDEKQADLFFVPEKHEGWVNIYPGPITGVVVYKTEEDAKHGANADAKVIATIKIEWEE